MLPFAALNGVIYATLGFAFGKLMHGLKRPATKI